MISLQNFTLRRGTKVLMQDVNWTIYHKQRIGIIGENGCGKTSLFKMFLGELQPDAGNFEMPARLKLSHVAQETPAYANSALEFVLDGDVELRQLEKDLIHAEEENDGHRIATLHARMGEIDAYTAPARAAQLLNGLGFNQKEQQQSVSDFSGGWRVRLNLAKALMCRSDVLLLDEPTNHLDLDAVLWLQNWLMEYPGTLLLISHDREFLDHVADHIAHVHSKEIKVYTGNYSAFEKLRAEYLLLQQAAFDKQQKHIAHMQSFINRFKAKASKARQAQSRVKAIARLELVSAVQMDSSFQFEFREPKKSPNPLICLDEAVVAYGDKIVLTDLNLQISPKERIALLGPNGAGKSSLIKLLAGEVDPASGLRINGEGLRIGYFAQHQVDYLDLSDTPLNHMRKIAPNTREQELRGFLGSFGFAGNVVLEPVTNFSGGEKSRLALALIVWLQPNLLLLDEPTNHLDLDMRQALSLALQNYEGAMILVSHDRFLVRTTVDQLMLVANGKLNAFEGDLDEYEQWLIDFRKQAIAGTAPAKQPGVSRKAQRQQDAKERELRKPLVQKVQKLEAELKQLQAQSAAIEIELADTDLYTEDNQDKLQKLITKQAELKKKVTAAESAWLQACEKLEIE